MSAASVVQAAIVAHLAGDAALAGVTIFDAPPVRGGMPYAVVGEPLLADWSARSLVAREGRIAVEIVDGGERPVRLRALAGAVEDALAAMPAALGEGWRVVTLIPVRARIVRAGDRWRSVSEFAVRMYRES